MGGLGFPVRGCTPAGLDGTEAGKMLPRQCTWLSDGTAEPQLPSCREPFAGPAGRGAACAWGQPEPLGWLLTAQSQGEHPATGRASETAHSSSLPVSQGAPGAD